VCAYRSCDSESDRVAALRLQPNRCRALGSQHMEPEKMTQEIKTNSFVISGGEQVGEGTAQRIEVRAGARASAARSDAEQPNLLHVYGRFTLHRGKYRPLPLPPPFNAPDLTRSNQQQSGRYPEGTTDRYSSCRCDKSRLINTLLYLWPTTTPSSPATLDYIYLI
jgi:hypothetical protein